MLKKHEHFMSADSLNLSAICILTLNVSQSVNKATESLILTWKLQNIQIHMLHNTHYTMVTIQVKREITKSGLTQTRVYKRHQINIRLAPENIVKISCETVLPLFILHCTLPKMD